MYTEIIQQMTDESIKTLFIQGHYIWINYKLLVVSKKKDMWIGRNTCTRKKNSSC